MGDHKTVAKLIRIAHENPEFRGDILPLIKEAAEDKAAYLVETFEDPFVRTWPKLLKDISGRLDLVDFRTFMRDQGDAVVEHPVREIPVKVKSLKGPDGVALRDSLFKEWRSPRAEKNWKTVVSYISKNTGNKVQEVGRNLQKHLGDLITQTSGQGQEAAKDVWSSIAGAYKSVDRRLQRYLGEGLGYKFASTDLASERELRRGLIRLAHANPDIRSDILTILTEED